jgi:hypothetical protein
MGENVVVLVSGKDKILLDRKLQQLHWIQHFRNTESQQSREPDKLQGERLSTVAKEEVTSTDDSLLGIRSACSFARTIVCTKHGRRSIRNLFRYELNHNRVNR